VAIESPAGRYVSSVNASSAQAEQRLSERIRQTWRLRAVDNDLEHAFGRNVLVAGRNLRNFGMELKHVDAGPLDLNSRQFDVLRRTRSDTPPFVFQFTAPPTHPWCFRIWALRHDALDTLGGFPMVTVSEREAEAFTMALIMGSRFDTLVEDPATYMTTKKANRYPGACLQCGDWVPASTGLLLRPQADKSPWAVIHTACRQVALPSLSTLEFTFDTGEPAYYLAKYDNELVPDEAWPEVLPPSSYDDPPLQPAYTAAARRYLRVAGVIDRTARPIIAERPQLRLVRQRTSAVEIAERVLRKARGENASPADIERAVSNLENQTTERILRQPWVDDASIERFARNSERLLNLRVPGPFVGRDSRRNYDEWPGLSIATWDWEVIREHEARARAKAQKLPRCSICGSPMWLDQIETHYSCQSHGDTNSGPTATC
jgi:hypothetical protein